MANFLGVDTGGTFTDLLLFNDETNTIRVHKVLSTPHAPEQAILQGIEALDIKFESLTVVHGSTVATNAVLEGKGVRTAYITNTGMADVLVIGRQARESLYDLTPQKKADFIAAKMCLEVATRLSADGSPLETLSKETLQKLKQQLIELQPEAVAINLLFSFLDDSEELKIEQLIQSVADDIFISRSSDVLPQYKEYERGMTTTLNAMVGPLMQGYLSRLQSRLANDIEQCSLAIMQSSGGTTSAEQAGRYPVNLLLSGPAGGLVGAQTVAAESSETRLLSFDMGGTSTDVSIIDGSIEYTTDASIGGHPVAVSMIDMHTIGAGGGSIANVDAGGLLLVGPESAGAAPGPACYGRGGVNATVTDANVVLGRLLPESFLGGQFELDKDAANVAVQKVADQLKVTLLEAAQGIIDVVNDHMVRALRVMSVERGEDPKEYTLVSFGGAGGLHVCALAEELEMKKALVPVNAGVLSALGMLAADASQERARSINKPLAELEQRDIVQFFDVLESQASAALLNGEMHDVGVQKTLDVRYIGQSHTLSVDWQRYDTIVNDFHQKHEETYGHQLAMAIELVNCRVRVTQKKTAFKLPPWEARSDHSSMAKSVDVAKQKAVVYSRYALQVGQCIVGPALITETSSTTWLAAGWKAEIDRVGNLLLSLT